MKISRKMNVRPLNKISSFNYLKYNSIQCSYYSTKQSSMNRKTHSDFNYCLDMIKTTDYNTFLSTLLVPQSLMRPAFAIKAFNKELMTIGKSKYDPAISQIKLQFWKEQIDKIFEISNNLKGLTNENKVNNLIIL